MHCCWSRSGIQGLECRDQAIIRNSVAEADVLGRSSSIRLAKILTQNNTQISAHTVWGIFHITILVHLLRYRSFFDPRSGPGPGKSFFQTSDPTKFFNKYFISLAIEWNIILYLVKKTKKKFQFCKMYGYKNRTANFSPHKILSPPLFCCCWMDGWMSEWMEKIGIRDFRWTSWIRNTGQMTEECSYLVYVSLQTKHVCGRS